MDEQSQLLQEDEASRQQALDLASFIVEAPAGAGKTELLTQRFLKLLQSVSQPEEIIAITFTNKAASEMRSRILDSLQDAANKTPVDLAHKQQTRELALKALACSASREWNLLENPSRLRIYTIDSLSSNLARQMPLMSRFGAQPGIREDAAIYYEEAANRTLELLETEGAGELVRRALSYFDNDGYRLGKLLADMLKKRDQWLNYTQGQNTADIAEAALGRMIAQDIAAAAKHLTPDMQQSLMPIARYAASNLACEDSIALLLDWQTSIPENVAALIMWCALCDLLLTGKGDLRKAVNTNQGLPATPEAKPYKVQLIALLDALRAMPGAEKVIARLRLLPLAGHDDEAWQIIATLGNLLNVAVAQLWLVFQSRGEVDFVEMAQRAVTALEDASGNPTDLALKLDYRVQHLLVDEFQDTSPTQIKLLNCLTQGWMPQDGRTLFAVGDPMQSIYRFRKANVGLFLRAAKEGMGDVPLTRLRLWRNNRSRPPVVDWINHAFADIFPAIDSVSRGAIAYREFAATKADEPGAGVQVHAFIANSSDAENEEEPGDEADESFSASVNDQRQQEANAIIQIIQQSQAEDATRRIAVLVRARNHLHALVTEIRRRNLPSLSFQAVEIEELANRQIVQDLLSLTHALHHRADRVHWLAILRAPWCGLMLADLQTLVADDRYSTMLSLMQDESRVQAMSADGRARLLHVRSIMGEALAQRGRQSISRWLHGVWLMLGGADCLWETGDVRDVQAFFQRVEQLDAAGQFSTEQLAQEVQKLYAAPDAKSNDYLQFMTIHKAKGLQFDTVILPGLDRKTGSNERPLLLWEEVALEGGDHTSAETDLVVAPLMPQGSAKSGQPSLYAYLKQLEKERAKNEDARVLYVAATRAERCLHLLGVAKLNADGAPQAPKNTFLGLLWPHVSPAFVAASQLPNAVSTSSNKGIQIADFVPKLVRLALPQVPEILRQPVRVPQQPSSTGKADPNLKVADEITEQTIKVGTLLHRYVELIANHGLQAWPLERIAQLAPAMRHWFMQQTFNKDEADSATASVLAALRRTLSGEQGRWVLQSRPSAHAELALSNHSGQKVSTHILDRTFTENGERWIIDYKSTHIDEAISEPSLLRLAERHREQLERYAALFKDEGLSIRKAVFFLTLARLVVLS